MQDFIPNQRRATISVRPLREGTAPSVFFYNGSPDHIAELRKEFEKLAAEHHNEQVLFGIKSQSRSTKIIVELLALDEFGPLYKLDDTWLCRLMAGPQPSIPTDEI